MSIKMFGHSTRFLWTSAFSQMGGPIISPSFVSLSARIFSQKLCRKILIWPYFCYRDENGTKREFILIWTKMVISWKHKFSTSNFIVCKIFVPELLPIIVSKSSISRKNRLKCVQFFQSFDWQMHFPVAWTP